VKFIASLLLAHFKNNEPITNELLNHF